MGNGANIFTTACTDFTAHFRQRVVVVNDTNGGLIVASGNGIDVFGNVHVVGTDFGTDTATDTAAGLGACLLFVVAQHHFGKAFHTFFAFQFGHGYPFVNIQRVFFAGE